MNGILAHGLGGRSDLPVPLWLAVYGGASAVVLSFLVLGALWLTPKLKGESAGRPIPEGFQRVIDARPTRIALRALGVLLFAITVLAAALGPNESATNPAPTWLYVWLWVGLVPASLAFGPVWRLVNPLRAFSAGIARLTGRGRNRPVPERLGYWPAAAGLVVFVWLELVFADASKPSTVLAFVAIYSLVQVALALRYGQGWYERGDSFEVYSSLVGRLSPLGRRSDGRLVVRNPLDGLASVAVGPGLVAVVCVLLGSTAFDGVTRTQLWSNLTRGTVGFENIVLGTLGLGWSIALVAATYLGATHLSARMVRGSRRSKPVTNPGERFVHSLIPIVVGYTVAHYFSLFVFQGQAGYILASDPFGRGWDLFGTGDWAINFLAVSTRAIALVQVAAIVTGHVLGVVAAHDRAVGLFSGMDRRRGQYALLAVMVLYTSVGILLLLGT
jgi:hypothetical protein